MIWNIFKKDVKLTWRLAALVAALHWMATALTTRMGVFFDGSLRNLFLMLVIGGLLGSGFLIIAAVQQDAIPGVRQDWLVRPIRRRDLLMAKLLFVVLIVQAPIFLADMTEALVSGLSLSSSFEAALQRALLQMLLVYLPFLAFASLTRNPLEAVSGGAVLVLTVALVANVISVNRIGPNGSPMASLEPVVRTGLEWIVNSATIAVLVVGAAVVLWLQYFHRRTVVARIFTGSVAGLCLLTAFIPWRPAFAIQSSLSNAPGSSRDIALNFDPEAGRFRAPAGGLTIDDTIAILRRGEGVNQVYLPFRVTGLPPDSAVRMDHSEVRLIETNGRMDRLELESWNARRQGSGSPSQAVYPPLEIPVALYERIKDQPVRLEVDYWMTLVQVASSHALPAINAVQDIPGLGSCRTNFNDPKTAIRFGCLGAGPTPTCFSVFLEHVPTGERNPEQFGCGSYSGFMRDRLPDALSRFGSNLPFRDSRGLAQFPVDGSKLRESRVVIQSYRAQDHFTRKLLIPEVRLGEWGADGR